MATRPREFKVTLTKLPVFLDSTLISIYSITMRMELSIELVIGSQFKEQAYMWSFKVLRYRVRVWFQDITMSGKYCT